MVVRDFRFEIMSAIAAGDTAALAELSLTLLVRAEQDEERRARQADKKRRQRSGDIGGRPALSRDVPGQVGTLGDVPAVVPPKRSLTTPPPPSAQVIAKLGDTKLQSSLDLLRGMMGEFWEDAAAFLLRRKYVTWQGWADGMLREVGMASQYTAADLARVCQDDATLEKPLGSAFILRRFLAPARQERLEASRSPPSGAARSGRISRRDTTPAGIPVPTSDPDVAPKWQT